MKLTITKQTAMNETIQIEVEVQDVDALGYPPYWGARMDSLLRRLDQRMLDLNLRMLQGGEALGQLDPKASYAAKTVLAMVHGIELPDGQG